MLRFVSIILTYLCVWLFAHSQDISTPRYDTTALDSKHSVFNNILKHIVQGNNVDYQLLKSQHAKQLAVYRSQLARTQVPTTADEKMALYINAYNALTLALTLELLPKDQSSWSQWSVRDQKGFWKNYRFEVAGTWLSLDQIEHKILRPMGDPRIHFAVNCASKSCPPLRAEAYTGDQLNKQLAAQLQLFVNSSYHIRKIKNDYQINPILKWFASDFKKDGGVRAYLIKHGPNQLKSDLQNKSVTLKFFSYDWALNHHIQQKSDIND